MSCSLTSRWFGYHRGSLKKEGNKKGNKKGPNTGFKDKQTLPGGFTNDLLANIKVVRSPKGVHLKKEKKKEGKKKKRIKRPNIGFKRQSSPGGLTNDLLTNNKVVWSS